MLFFTTLSIASASFVSAGVPNDAITDLFSRAGEFQKLVDFNLAQNTFFTKEDLAKVLPSLKSYDNIKDLLVNDKVSFSLKGLSVPEKEADKAIVDAIIGTKLWSNIWIKTYVAKKTAADSIEETKKEFQVIIAELSKNEKSVLNDIAKVDEIFTKYPEFACVIHYSIATIPETFDKDGLDYAKLFLTEVRAFDPKLVAKLWSLVEWAQTKHNLLPEAQFNQLKEVFTSFQ